MIKATELRIGNWVDQPNKGVTKVTSILNDLQIRTETGYIDKYCRAIPLTEEWLLKFGAKELKPKRGILKEFVLKTVRIEMSNNGNFYYKNSKLILQSIHQLQNLYFALTGEELD